MAAMIRRGFTLVEVLLVVLIITILSVAGFGGIIRLQQNAEANEIQSEIIDMINLSRSYALNGKQLKKCGETDGAVVLPRAFGVKIDASSKKLYLFADQKDPQNEFDECEILKVYPSSDLSFSQHLTIEDSLNGLTWESAMLLYAPPFADFSFLTDTTNLDLSHQITVNIFQNADVQNNEDSLPLKQLTFSTRLGIPQ